MVVAGARHRPAAAAAAATRSASANVGTSTSSTSTSTSSAPNYGPFTSAIKSTRADRACRGQSLEACKQRVLCRQLSDHPERTPGIETVGVTVDVTV
eukprot:2512941-Rhodomonas_salina.6